MAIHTVGSDLHYFNRLLQNIKKYITKEERKKQQITLIIKGEICDKIVIKTFLTFTPYKLLHLINIPV